MCKFFSITTKGDGVPMYIPLKERKLIVAKKSKYENPDSHTSINEYFGLKGADEDKTNKYEFDYFKNKFIVDQINTTDDTHIIEKWFKKFLKTKEFKSFLFYYFGDLNLRGCDLKGITLPQSIGGYLDLRGCDLKGITLPQSIGGSLYLSGCDLKGITLPQSIGGYLDLSGCDLKGIDIPKKLQSKIIK